MLLKLAALGALGYAGYKVYEKNWNGERRDTDGRSPGANTSRDAVSGGPLSDQAQVVKARQTF